MYYLRSKPASQAKKITLENPPTNINVNFKNQTNQDQAAIACSLENPDACEACGS